MDSGVSQEQPAKLADLHPTYVSGIGRGRRNLSLQSIDRLTKGARDIDSLPSNLGNLESGPRAGTWLIPR
jgi:hypothetical protein